ncbi:hypothetical protein FOB20_13990 [Acinetobacter lwoffii]|uniref:hypothetical protein n=1 Tax=Acinetobacter lwoffii TaxID=28090 RepID=UPI001581515E|nr:hypothetical protein [Acinetobacter lwoffii]QKT99771.1 hypothetical protein FOB20_13990 [Acinetobacter lwoffii]
MKELIKSEVESVEGEYLTDTEYRMDQVMKRYQEQLMWAKELERTKRRREIEIDLYEIRSRFNQSVMFAEALHRYEVERAKKKQHSKELDKALMLIFLIIGAGIIKVIFL